MRFNQQTFTYKTRSLNIFHDVCCRWFAEAEGQIVRVPFDFATGLDSIKERTAAIELGKLIIEHKV